MATVASPVEILPRPGSAGHNAGVTSRLNNHRRHRTGPLVFVNSSDFNTDLEKLSNRKMVKKWAMLNRVCFTQRPSLFFSDAETWGTPVSRQANELARTRVTCDLPAPRISLNTCPGIRETRLAQHLSARQTLIYPLHLPPNPSPGASPHHRLCRRYLNLAFIIEAIVLTATITQNACSDTFSKGAAEISKLHPDD